MKIYLECSDNHHYLSSRSRYLLFGQELVMSSAVLLLFASICLSIRIIPEEQPSLIALTYVFIKIYHRELSVCPLAALKFHKKKRRWHGMYLLLCLYCSLCGSLALLLNSGSVCYADWRWRTSLAASYLLANALGLQKTLRLRNAAGASCCRRA